MFLQRVMHAVLAKSILAWSKPDVNEHPHLKCGCFVCSLSKLQREVIKGVSEIAFCIVIAVGLSIPCNMNGIKFIILQELLPDWGETYTLMAACLNLSMG